MRLDGFGLFVCDMGKMIRFYRDVLGFEIRVEENTSNVYLVKDGTLFLLYGRKDFEKMTSRRYEYIKGLQRTCYIADPEGNLIEIGSWNKPYEEKDLAEN